jgi:pilus assembly protein Flp/PilA
VTIIFKLISRLYEDEEGQGLVEYALILVLIAIAVIASMTLLGKKVNNTFNNIQNKLGS